LADFWAWDGNALKSKKNPRTKTLIANHFPFISFTIHQHYPIFIPYPSFENKGELIIRNGKGEI